MAYLSEEKKQQQELEQIQEQRERAKRTVARDAFFVFLQQELGVHLTSEQKIKLIAYIKQRFNVCQCCVLYGRTERVRSMLSSLGLPENSLGTKEFIITENFTVLYSPDYKRKRPQPIKTTYGRA